MSDYADHENSVTVAQQEKGMAATYATPDLPANLVTENSLADVQRVFFTGHQESTPAIIYASTLGKSFDPALQQDYVPRQGPILSFQHQPLVSNNPGPDQPPRFVCLVPGCLTTCSRANDLGRHYKAQHQNPGFKPEFKCRVEGCNRKEVPFNREDKLREHMRNIHNIGAWRD